MHALLQSYIDGISMSSGVNTFGIILYNDSNPNMKKLLSDTDYWNALEFVSGKKFIVFVVKPKVGEMVYPKTDFASLGMLVPIYDEPTENKEILELFNIDSTKDLPLFSVFTKVDTYLLTYNLKLEDSSFEELFKNIKDIFQKIQMATEKIHSSYQEHDAQVHDKIVSILRKHKMYSLVGASDGFLKRAGKYFNLIA